MENDVGKCGVLHLRGKNQLRGKPILLRSPKHAFLCCNKKGTMNSTKRKIPSECPVLNKTLRCLSQRTYKVHCHRQESPNEKLNRPKGLRLSGLFSGSGARQLRNSKITDSSLIAGLEKSLRDPRSNISAER